MKMRFYRKLAGLGLAAVLIATTLVACGQQPGEGVTTGPSASPAAEMSVEEHFQKGNEYIQTGQFDKAVAEFEAVLKAEPERVSALTNLGVAYYNVLRLEDAIAQYQKALEVGPDDADIHSNMAAAYVQKGDLAQALAEYQKAITINPKLAQAHFGLAVVYLQQGQNDQAVKELQEFQANDDGADKLAAAQANVYLGAIYLDQGEAEKALVEYQKALQVDPKLAAAHFGLGLVYSQLGQKDQAIKALEQFQQYDDGTNSAMTDQAAQLLEQLKGQ
jgi:Tfp pilus assembly protein PilF